MKIYNNNTNKDKTKQNNCFNIIRSYIKYIAYVLFIISIIIIHDLKPYFIYKKCSTCKTNNTHYNFNHKRLLKCTLISLFFLK